MESIWKKLKDWSTKIAIVLALVGTLSTMGVYVKKQLDKRFLDFFDTLATQQKQYAVNMGILMDMLNRVDGEDSYYTILNGDRLDVMIFETDNEDKIPYVFVVDPILGYVPFRGYYDTRKDYWYFYSFEKIAFTKIYKK